MLDENEDVKVSLDLSARVESTRMGDGGVLSAAAKAGEERRIGDRHLSMLDWTAIHQDLLE